MSFVLAVVLWFTVPSQDAATRDVVGGGSILLCDSGPDSCRDVASVTVWRLDQSATWVASRDSMLASSAAWEALWPRVREEAMPRVLATYPLSPVMAGARTSVAVPDSLWRGALFVTFKDASGNNSCWSNLVGKPQ